MEGRLSACPSTLFNSLKEYRLIFRPLHSVLGFSPMGFSVSGGTSFQGEVILLPPFLPLTSGYQHRFIFFSLLRVFLLRIHERLWALLFLSNIKGSNLILSPVYGRTLIYPVLNLIYRGYAGWHPLLTLQTYLLRQITYRLRLISTRFQSWLEKTSWTIGRCTSS